MTSNYKRLGGYIRQVDVRNKGLKVDRLLGVSISKEFMPSIANTIGTDMSNYKVVRNGQFAYGPVTSRNGDKVSVALLQDGDAIISQAYTVFEIIDSEQLSADYLMMWFRRPEFDRYARFHSHGSAREVFDWDEMCDVMLPVPSIDRQRELVAQYESLSRRIRINEQMIATLEDTAQTLYRKMFVEGIDKENLPEGWRMGKVGDLLELQRGFDLPSQNRQDGLYPIYASTGVAAYHNAYKIAPPCVITGRSGSIGEVFYYNDKCWPLNTTLWVKDFKGTPPFFVFYKLKELELGKTIAGFAAVPTLNRNDVHSMDCIIPIKCVMEKFDCYLNCMHKNSVIITRELSTLRTLQSLLLTKLSNA